MIRLLIKILLLFVCLAPTLISCGSDLPQLSATIPTQTPPVIQRLDPATLARGATLSVFGFGYSIVPEENIVTIGARSQVAESYDVVANGANGEAEVLTLTLPQDLPIGDQTVFVIVQGRTSNADLTVTVQP